MSLKYSIILLILFLSQSIFCGNLRNNERITPIPPGIWAHEQSGISYDESRLSFGKLENQMRYAIATSDENPKCEVSLMISVGSLVEEAQEAGMAHFLEHMVFRNSDNFPNGELYNLLSDTIYGDGPKKIQAFTNHTSTIYSVSLKQCSEIELQAALKILGDIAFRAKFNQEDLKKEAQIIDGEHAMRLHQISREKSEVDKFFNNHKLLDISAKLWPTFEFKHPMGTKQIRDGFTVQSLQDFYRRWYVPENMVIAYAGATDKLTVKELMAKEFSDFAHRVLPHSKSTIIHEQESSIFLVPAIIPYQTKISFEDVSSPFSNKTFDEASLRAEVIYLAVAHILKEALIDSVLTLVKSKSGQTFFNLEIEPFSNKNYKEPVLKAFATLNSYAKKGFSENEINKAKDYIREYFKGRILKNSPQDLMNAISEDFAHSDLTWPQLPSWLEEELANINSESCMHAYQKAWLNQREREGFFATGTLKYDEDTLKSFQTLLYQAKKLVDYYIEDQPMPIFAYETPAPLLDELPLVMKRYGNEYKMTLKNGPNVWSSIHSKKKRLMVMMVFGESLLEKVSLDYAWLIPNFKHPKKHSSKEIKQLFPNFTVKIIPTGDGLTAFGFAPVGKLEDLLRLMRAYLIDPDFSYLKKDTLIARARLASDSFSLIDDALLAKFVWQTSLLVPQLNWEELNAQLTSKKPKDLEAIMKERVNKGICQLGFRGLVDTSEALSSFAKIFGDFTWQSTVQRKQIVLHPGCHIQENFLGNQCPAARVLLLFPLNKKIAPHQRRDFEALAFFLEKNIFITVRQQLGEGYSPKVMIMDFQGAFSDFIYVELWTTVENASMISKSVSDLAINLAQAITPEDHQAAMSNARGRYKGGNSNFISFWMDTPHNCRENKNFDSTTLSNLEELKQLAREVFVQNGSSSMVLLPKNSQ